jgi:hypothetical protein
MVIVVGTSAVDHRSDETSYGMCCFLATHTTFGSKRKDWLYRRLSNVSEWLDWLIVRFFFIFFLYHYNLFNNTWFVQWPKAHREADLGAPVLVHIIYSGKIVNSLNTHYKIQKCTLTNCIFLFLFYLTGRLICFIFQQQLYKHMRELSFPLKSILLDSYL